MPPRDLLEESTRFEIDRRDLLDCGWIVKGKVETDRWITDLIGLQDPSVRSELCSALFPGRRIRPSLMLQLAGAAHDTSTEALILELFHSSSIIVDDILDGDDGRREIPNSLYKVGANAVLVSHFLASLVWDLASKTNRIPAVQRAYRNMCLAEFADIFVTSRPEGWVSLYEERVLAKTECLFELAFIWGLERQTAVPPSHAYKLGRSLGALFQMSNDIFDTTAVSRTQRNTRNYKYPLSVTLPLACFLDGPEPSHLKERILRSPHRLSLPKEEIDALDTLILAGGFLHQAEERFCHAISAFKMDMERVSVDLSWLTPFLNELEDYSIWTKDYEAIGESSPD
jgi:geranylgeranyl pyrophosphate synthase